MNGSALSVPHIDRRLTIDRCQFRCFGYSYFGVENGRQCYCGNAIQNGAIPADMTGCDVQCAGNRNQVCGGDGMINIYQVQQAASPGQPRIVTYTYDGCYTEPEGGRALTKIYTSLQQTQDKCLRDCAYGGYTYAAVEDGTDCWCGNNLADGTQRARESDCTSPCSGDSFQSCGGTRRFALFKFLGSKLMRILSYSLSFDSCCLKLRPQNQPCCSRQRHRKLAQVS